METRTARIEKNRDHKLGRTLAIFGVALVASVGLGLLLASGDDGGDGSPVVHNEAARRVIAPDRPTTDRFVAEGGPAAGPVTSPDAPVAPVGPVVIEATAAEDLPPVAYAEAETAFFARDWERAAELFARYSADRPGNVWGHFMLGLAQRRAGDVRASETAFLAALEIDADHAKSLVNLGRTLLDAGRAADARPHLEHAVAVDASSGDAWRVLGRTFHSLGLTSEALDAYDVALEIDPEDAWSLNNRGLVLIEAEQFEEALAYLERACAVDERPACFQNNLGVARERTGDIAGARAAYAAALDADDAGNGEKARTSLARVEGLPLPTEESAPRREGILVQGEETVSEPTLVVAGAERDEMEEIR